MDERTQDNKRIAKNTMMLYFRMLLTMVVGLYTSRVVLQTLGVSDYGLYNVVGGIVAMFTIINSTLTTGTQRFFSFAIGEGNIQKLKGVFSTAFLLHFVLAVILLIVAETIGLWFLNAKMNIPTGRETAAFWVYQYSVLAALVSVIQVPFVSSMQSHERMNIYAYMSIYDVVMKLFIVFLIQVVDYDKLIFYGCLILLVNVSSAFIYNWYCRKHFEESRFKFGYDKQLVKEIATFSGWNIFGCASVTLQGQGVNILLNMFFGTIVNAARGIAFNVNTIVLQFVNNFQTAVNPQIVKLYAAGKTDEMTKLVINNSKFAAYLLLFIAVPLTAELDFVLRIWLGEVPEYTTIFIYIILFQSLVQTITRPVVMVVHAVGKMKAVNLTAGSALLLILPVSYVLMRLGADPVTVFLVNLIPWFFETLFELYFEKKYIGFPMLGFYKDVYGHVFPLAALMLVAPLAVRFAIPSEGWFRFILVGFTSVISSSLIILYLGINKSLRYKLVNKAKIILNEKMLYKSF